MTMSKSLVYRSSDRWVNLALVALAGLYIAFVVLELFLNGPLTYIGQDFTPIYTSAQIARDHGLANVYDPTLQKEYQNRIILDQFGVPWPYAYTPLPYLPPFLVPLIPLASLPPLVAFAVWAGLNGLVLAGYVWWLARAVDAPHRTRIVMGLVLSLPAFLTIPFGQINVWLLVCTGQAFLAFRARRDTTAGLWLSGLLLKPQILILILPGLFIARRYRAVWAFAASALVILAASLILCGVDGLTALASLVVGYGSLNGVATNGIDQMMNWRALAVNLAVVAPAGIAWGIALCGMATTAVAALWLWWPQAESEPDWTQIWLATWAATLVVTWHSHVHMAITMLPLLLYFWIERRRFGSIVTIWLTVPIILFLALAFGRGPALAHSVIGVVMLALTLPIVFSIVRSRWATVRGLRALAAG
jgi:hypothetical protein